MLPTIVHWFTMEKSRSVHLGNTERKNPNLCPSTGDLTLLQRMLNGFFSSEGKDCWKSLALKTEFIVLYHGNECFGNSELVGSRTVKPEFCSIELFG